MSVITISRQYGSGGDEIAARVCEILDYRYFDQRLMSQVAVKAGLSEDGGHRFLGGRIQEPELSGEPAGSAHQASWRGTGSCPSIDLESRMPPEHG